MMFHKIRQRLLISYLGVLISILAIFAIAIRITFEHVLTQQLTQKLTLLASAVANSEDSPSEFNGNQEFSYLDRSSPAQSLQWFNEKGNLVAQQGKAILNLPVLIDRPIQVQIQENTRFQGVTLPIINKENQTIGYIRASQSLEEIDENLQKLNFGLGGGITLALLLSGLGGLWLTRQAMQPIEESFDRLKQFTADASHELRSPLMAIKSNAAVALKYPEAMRPADMEKFQAIASATNQMSQLTEDLLLLARSDKESDGLRLPVDIAEILTALVQLYQSQATDKQIDLQISVTSPLLIIGDTIGINRLFTNLIINAIHYTAPNGMIIIKAERNKMDAIVCIQDTGIGIAPENIERIFDRFWRADSSRSHWDNGSGLGLAIVRSIIQNHRGTIEVTSKLAIGSRFIVRLPIVDLKNS
jgi:OmpR-family two-component system manganese-sensing sensor histidine kinase